jgi:hypothetical protein
LEQFGQICDLTASTADSSASAASATSLAIATYTQSVCEDTMAVHNHIVSLQLADNRPVLQQEDYRLPATQQLKILTPL